MTFFSEVKTVNSNYFQREDPGKAVCVCVFVCVCGGGGGEGQGAVRVGVDMRRNQQEFTMKWLI